MTPRRPAPPRPLPTRDGVGPSCVSLPEGPWPTIAEFLVQHFPAVPAATWAVRVARGEVVDEHGVAVTAQRRHQPRLRVYYYRAVDDEARLPLEEQVLFQDEHIVAADKPHFLPVTPSGRYVQESLLVRLKRRLGIDTLAPLHRIDRETAGVVLFAVQPAERGHYQRLFERREVDKHYECIACFRPELALPATRRSRLVEGDCFMRMGEAEGEPNSETRRELIEARGEWARYGLTPVTGRRHQLRVHCMAWGMPIAGDLIYPTLFPMGSDDPAKPLQLLAQRIAFTDPITGEPRAFASRQRLRLDDAGSSENISTLPGSMS